MATLNDVSVETWPEDPAVGHARSSQISVPLFPDRRPGSPGNAEATSYVAGLLSRVGWPVEQREFAVRRLADRWRFSDRRRVDRSM